MKPAPFLGFAGRGCGIPDYPHCAGLVAFGARVPGAPFWDSEVQEENFAHVGMELADDFSVQLTQEKFTNAINPIPTTPEPWASHLRPPADAGDSDASV